jgi:ribonuclease HI
MSNGHKIEAWGDGVCEPTNPGGHAAWGIRICVDGAEVHTAGGYVGCSKEMSNNVAEYSAFCAIARWVRTSDLRGILTVRMDSKLVINQLAGKWKVNGGFYYPYFLEARQLLSELKGLLGGVELVWIPRDKNAECDKYSKKVLLDRGVKFRIQPQTEEVK